MLDGSRREDIPQVTPPARPASGQGWETDVGRERLEEGDMSQESCNPVAATVPCAVVL